MVLATNLGFPRIGDMRQLKKAVEAYWKGQSSQAELQAEAAKIRAYNWKLQKDAGLNHIPSNDFSFYDQVLDMICTLGLVPHVTSMAAAMLIWTRILRWRAVVSKAAWT